MTTLKDKYYPPPLKKAPANFVHKLEGGDKGTCVMCTFFGRSDVLTRSVDTPIIIEDSASEIESEDELPIVEELLLERKGGTPVAESMNKDPGTRAAVGHRDCAGDSGDDTMRSAQLSEDGDGSGAGAGDSSDDDHNATRIGLQVLKQRKRARSLPTDTTTRTLGTANPDRLEGPHLAKRQRPCFRTGDESESIPTSTPNPISSWLSKRQAVIIGGESCAIGNEKTADSDAGDGGLNEPIGPAGRTEPPTQSASASRQSPGYRHEPKSLPELGEELGEMEEVGNGRIVDHGHRSPSLVRAAPRQRRAKPPPKATPATTRARRRPTDPQGS